MARHWWSKCIIGCIIAHRLAIKGRRNDGFFTARSIFFRRLFAPGFAWVLSCAMSVGATPLVEPFHLFRSSISFWIIHVRTWLFHVLNFLFQFHLSIVKSGLVILREDFVFWLKLVAGFLLFSVGILDLHESFALPPLGSPVLKPDLEKSFIFSQIMKFFSRFTWNDFYFIRPCIDSLIIYSCIWREKPAKAFNRIHF